jgi:hypothetical protein
MPNITFDDLFAYRFYCQDTTNDEFIIINRLKQYLYNNKFTNDTIDDYLFQFYVAFGHPITFDEIKSVVVYPQIHNETSQEDDENDIEEYDDEEDNLEDIEEEDEEDDTIPPLIPQSPSEISYNDFSSYINHYLGGQSQLFNTLLSTLNNLPNNLPNIQLVNIPYNIPATVPSTNPTSEPTSEPTTESTTEPPTESTTESTTESATESTTESTTEPITESATESTGEPTTEPITEPTTQPVNNISGTTNILNNLLNVNNNIQYSTFLNLLNIPLNVPLDIPFDTPLDIPPSSDTPTPIAISYNNTIYPISIQYSSGGSMISNNLISSILLQPSIQDVVVTTDEDDLSKMTVYTIDELIQDKCSICMSGFEKGDEYLDIECKHKFHKECLTTYLQKYNHICPVCRTDIGKTKVNY